jgi:hypothetical protein
MIILKNPRIPSTGPITYLYSPLEFFSTFGFIMEFLIVNSIPSTIQLDLAVKWHHPVSSFSLHSYRKNRHDRPNCDTGEFTFGKAQINEGERTTTTNGDFLNPF